jgi:hypothetical protein
MTEEYVASWLADQIDDSPEKFPPNYDFDSIVDQLNDWFDDQIVSDHLDELLAKLLNRNK